MSPPLIFIATNRLKPGALDAERARVPELSSFIEATEPRVLAFNEYANEDGTEVAVVQIHPDVASLQNHVGVIRERAQRAYAETLDVTTSIQVFGALDDAMLKSLAEQTGSGVTVKVVADHLGGFTRPSPQPRTSSLDGTARP
jgi:NAD-dependent oxidoreductase involved in siderophore biosynthesis